MAHILAQLYYFFEVSLARRQNLKLGWEDAWNHAGIKLSVKWVSHDLLGLLLFAHLPGTFTSRRKAVLEPCNSF